MSVRENLRRVLHVAPPKGMQHATNQPSRATPPATNNATTAPKASNNGGLYARPHATTMQQVEKCYATTGQQPGAIDATAVVVKTLLEADALSGDLVSIRAWLAFIGENDPRIINDILENCRADAEHLRYFVGRAREVPK